MRIEPASPDDADAIAGLHVAEWRRVYRDLAPADAYAALDEPLRRRQWRAAFAGPEGAAGVFIARDAADRLAGFGKAHLDPGGPMGARGEIKHLYIAEHAQRQGVGRALFRAMAAHLAALGAGGLALGVVDGNLNAIRFYERLGGRRDGAYVDPGPLWRSRNLIYAWDLPVD